MHQKRNKGQSYQQPNLWEPYEKIYSQYKPLIEDLTNQSTKWYV